jgi:secreted trypsin-like serine protease
MRARLGIAGIAICVLAIAAGTARAVLGGQPDTNHPYVVMLAGPTSVCTGTALSSSVVLTAAHCFAADSGGSPLPGIHVYTDQAPQPGAFEDTGTFYFDPQFAGLGNGIPHADTHDVAVVILDQPLNLPQYGALPTIGAVDKLKNNAPIDLVGYGVVGFARGGGQPQQVALFQRFAGQTTLIASNDAISSEFLKLHNGTCFGDSGGPDLQGGTNIVLAENSFVNNNVCAGDTYSYRVDTAQAQSWIKSTVLAHGGHL